ncbi:MAG: DUF4837 family protein [Bacteroidota bacterium]|nr:DUF4837 family protein [Bacteroidota bacterium]
MKQLTSLFIACVLSLFLISSCSKQKLSSAFENEDKIYVIADSLEFMQIQPALDSVFQKVIYTPQPETTFFLQRKNFNELDNLKNFQNIIIAAPLNSGSSVSSYLNSILDAKLKNSALSGTDESFSKDDLWTKDQLVIILTSKNIEGLSKNILKNGPELYQRFQKISDKKFYENLYNPEFENKSIEAKFLKEYGWILNVQNDFSLVLDKPEDKFVWLRSMPKNDLAKWIFVHWIDNASPAFLNPDSIAKERNMLTKKYLKPAGSENFVKITEEFKTTSDMNFHGNYALAMQGLWEMSDKSMGGPFINYTQYDEKSKRIYMIDASVYAPNYIKKGLIRQLDILLQSFQTTEQVSDLRKKELLR